MEIIYSYQAINYQINENGTAQKVSKPPDFSKLTKPSSSTAVKLCRLKTRIWMATMEEQFKEDWDAECGICFERRDFYLIKHCACSVPVCMECYFSIQNTQGGYSCPGCRNVPPPIRELTEAQTVVRAVWELLHTGPFTLNRGAGVCLDREASRVF